MDFAFTPDQEMLRETVRRLLEDRSPMARLREVMDTESGLDEELWVDLAGLGFAGMHIPERFGGAGLGQLELGIVMEELGRALVPLPMLSSIVLGANLLLVAGTDQQKADLLPGVAAGTERLAVALVDDGASWSGPGAVSSNNRVTTAAADGGSIVLEGTKSFVVDGQSAHTLIVAAVGDGALDLFLVEVDAPGVDVRPVDVMDPTRKQATVALDGVRVDEAARLGAGGGGQDALGRLFDLAVVGLAFEQVGGAQKCLDTAVEYAKERHQFGRPIGSFQAVKHKCAEMLVRLEAAKAIAYYAGWAADAGESDFLISAALAKSYCSDAYFFCASQNIQVHGGIGFTWEHDAHLYFKRAKTSQLMFGDSTFWRALLADRLGV